MAHGHVLHRHAACCISVLHSATARQPPVGDPAGCLNRAQLDMFLHTISSAVPATQQTEPAVCSVQSYCRTQCCTLSLLPQQVEELQTEPIWVINNGVAHGDSEFSLLCNQICVPVATVLLGVRLLSPAAWQCWQLGEISAASQTNQCCCGCRLPHAGCCRSFHPPHRMPPSPCNAHVAAAGVRGADIMPWVEEALDSIEFISGPADR